jgi:hypothetical protein
MSSEKRTPENVLLIGRLFEKARSLLKSRLVYALVASSLFIRGVVEHGLSALSRRWKIFSFY